MNLLCMSSLLNPHPAWKCSLLLSTYQIQSLSSICSKSICFQVSLLHSASDAVIQWLWFSMQPAAVPASAGIRVASTDQASCPGTQAGSVSKAVPSRARGRRGAGLLLSRAAVGMQDLQQSQVSLRRKMGSWQPAQELPQLLQCARVSRGARSWFTWGSFSSDTCVIPKSNEIGSITKTLVHFSTAFLSHIWGKVHSPPHCHNPCLKYFQGRENVHADAFRNSHFSFCW